MMRTGQSLLILFTLLLLPAVPGRAAAWQEEPRTLDPNSSEDWTLTCQGGREVRLTLQGRTATGAARIELIVVDARTRRVIRTRSVPPKNRDPKRLQIIAIFTPPANGPYLARVINRGDRGAEYTLAIRGAAGFDPPGS